MTASVEVLLRRPAPTFWIWRVFCSVPTETAPVKSVTFAPANSTVVPLNVAPLAVALKSFVLATEKAPNATPVSARKPIATAAVAVTFALVPKAVPEAPLTNAFAPNAEP